MKTLIVTIVVNILAGLAVFTGYHSLMVTTKDSVVDSRKYLGNRMNPAQIYASPSEGVVYSPLNMDIIMMDKLMLIDIEDDPEYACIELQTFDDARGRGARVLLYHHQGPADFYYTSTTFAAEESDHNKSYIDPHMKYHLEVTNSGLNAWLRMRDHNGKTIEFIIKETQRKKWSKGFLSPIGASDAVLFPYFPFFHMKDMNFVRRSGTKITVTIGGQARKPRKLPFPVNLEFVYLSRYTNAPVIACWNRPHNGALHPFRPTGQSTFQRKMATYKLINNHGHYEIRRMVGFNERNQVSVDFSPPLPDLVGLKDGTDLDGRFCAGVDDVTGIIAGTYRLKRHGHIIHMEILPQEGWQPMPGRLWVKNWIWKCTLMVAPNNTVAMRSSWIKRKGEMKNE